YGLHAHEATQQAGGRFRSYFDAATNLTIDNGNHLLLSGNRHALAYARSIGTEAGLVGPKRAQFPFVDLGTPEGSAGLAGAVVRETLLAGGRACRPLIARDGLSAVLVEPAIRLLQDKGAIVRFGHELHEFSLSAGRV